jgi:cytochrome c553
VAPLSSSGERGPAQGPRPPIAAHRRLAATVVAACGALLLAAAPAQAAGDAKAGRNKALQCQTCHGLDGMAKLPEAPNLAGQSEVYLVKALTDYKSGARRNEMMSLVSPALTEKDIADLAAFYSALSPQP